MQLYLIIFDAGKTAPDGRMKIIVVTQPVGIDSIYRLTEDCCYGSATALNYGACVSFVPCRRLVRPPVN
jgi:hypothetical protein